MGKYAADWSEWTGPNADSVAAIVPSTLALVFQDDAQDSHLEGFVTALPASYRATRLFRAWEYVARIKRLPYGDAGNPLSRLSLLVKTPDLRRRLISERDWDHMLALATTLSKLQDAVLLAKGKSAESLGLNPVFKLEELFYDENALHLALNWLESIVEEAVYRAGLENLQCAMLAFGARAYLAGLSTNVPFAEQWTSALWPAIRKGHIFAAPGLSTEWRAASLQPHPFVLRISHPVPPNGPGTEKLIDDGLNFAEAVVPLLLARRQEEATAAIPFDAVTEDALLGKHGSRIFEDIWRALKADCTAHGGDWDSLSQVVECPRSPARNRKLATLLLTLVDPALDRPSSSERLDGLVHRNLSLQVLEDIARAQHWDPLDYQAEQAVTILCVFVPLALSAYLAAPRPQQDPEGALEHFADHCGLTCHRRRKQLVLLYPGHDPLEQELSALRSGKDELTAVNLDRNRPAVDFHADRIVPYAGRPLRRTEPPRYRFTRIWHRFRPIGGRIQVPRFNWGLLG